MFVADTGCCCLHWMFSLTSFNCCIYQSIDYLEFESIVRDISNSRRQPKHTMSAATSGISKNSRHQQKHSMSAKSPSVNNNIWRQQKHPVSTKIPSISNIPQSQQYPPVSAITPRVNNNPQHQPTPVRSTGILPSNLSII